MLVADREDEAIPNDGSLHGSIPGTADDDL